MSFLFDFASTEDHENQNADGTQSQEAENKTQPQAEGTDKEEVKALAAREVTQFCSDELTSKMGTIMMEFGECNLKVVDTSAVERLILEDESFKQFSKSVNLTQALTSHSDLVAGIYEGGLKMWECGTDLAHFLSTHPQGRAIEIEGKRVLELGCGAGLPGAYCCSCKAKAVDFQDYNEEVLQLITQWNATTNTAPRGEVASATKSRFFSGDWSSLDQLLQQENLVYDVILSAETIYNPDNYRSLHNVFNSALSRDGVIIISAKVYYFGVGGSIEAFTEYVEAEQCFTCETVHNIKAGVPRKILILRRLHRESDSR